MKTKEEFKLFVQKHPELVNHVKNNEMTWQKFYEMYSLYEEDNQVWEPYFKKENQTSNATTAFSELMGMIKNVNVDNVRKNIETIQKGLGFLSEFVKKDNPTSTSGSRPSRAIYRRFDD